MKLYKIKKSGIDNKGRGLYATRDIKEGTKIIDYIGKLITKKQMQADQVHFLNEDVLDSEINNASVVVINFVLQFIKITDRSKLFRKIHKGLVPGGILILSEKVHFNSQRQTKEEIQKIWQTVDVLVLKKAWTEERS